MNNVYNTSLNEIKTYSDMPSTANYFQEMTTYEIITLPRAQIDIERVSSVNIKPQVISAKIISTPISLSQEGQNLSGHKLVVEVYLKQIFKYTSADVNHSVHSFNYDEIKKSVYIVIPIEYGGVKVSSLVRRNKFIVTPYITDIYYKVMNKRQIFNSISLLVDFKFIK